MFLCYKSPEISPTPTPHPLLRDTSHVPLLFHTHPKGLHDLDVLLRQRTPRLQLLELMTIFGNAWVTDNGP